MGDLVILQTLSYLTGSIGVMVGVVYYIFSVRDTKKSMKTNLETRQAQLFIQLFSHYNTREFVEDYMIVISTEYSGLEDWYKRYFNKEGEASLFPAWIRVGRFFDGAGILVKKRLIDVELANELLRELVIQSWEAMKLWVYDSRKGTKNEAVWRNFEYLYEEVKKTQPDMITRDEILQAGATLRESLKNNPS